MKRAFQTVVSDLFQSKGKTCVLTIDEAQCLELDMIQEFRFIMNHHVDSFSPLALILAGQPEFRSVMRTLPLAAIRRRVDSFYHLAGMSAQETAKYIAHQMTVAGAKHPVFPDDVVERIHEHSKGIAAHINVLCKGCLLDAASRDQKLIDHSNLERATNEFW
jgi:type II secretory pathway predicted ATPase ExeA